VRSRVPGVSCAANAPASLHQRHLEGRLHQPFEKMAAAGRAVTQAEHDMNVEARFAAIVDGDVTECAQHLALLLYRDLAISLADEIEPPDRRFGECTECSQRRGAKLSFSGNSEMIEKTSSSGSRIMTKVR
jgi:hypothetical protein